MPTKIECWGEIYPGIFEHFSDQRLKQKTGKKTHSSYPSTHCHEPRVSRDVKGLVSNSLPRSKGAYRPTFHDHHGSV